MMGNQNSIDSDSISNEKNGSETENNDPWWPKNTNNDVVQVESTTKKIIYDDKNLQLSKFKEELRKKRETRQSTMADIRREMDSLRSKLQSEKAKNDKLVKFIESNITSDQQEVLCTILNEPDVQEQDKGPPEPECSSYEDKDALISIDDDDDKHIGNKENDPVERNQTIELKKDLSESQFQLQLANAEILSLETDVGRLRTQVHTLKEVIVASKEMISVREVQVEQLQSKLKEIENSLQEREMKIMSEELRREYDRQLINIRNLRELYEERERVSKMERDNLLRQLDLKKSDLEVELEKTKNLEEHISTLQTDVSNAKDEQSQTQYQLNMAIAETNGLKAEMGVINQFISKTLLGININDRVNDINIDKLTAILEDNRALLKEMTCKESESFECTSFLPKLLYDLVTQVDDGNQNISDETNLTSTSNSQIKIEEIADKLPKVWRVLIELLSHQNVDQVPFVENGEGEDCYKSVQTPAGPKSVLSVSKTYIKLKDLIMEKKSLRKETDRLKTLNNHLEKRLETQEKRLSAVSLELTKTWHLVGRMQRQHRQLHTQEQILRYHLQQKRRLLSELKEELEYCRKKWTAARQKNSETEVQWKQLKMEVTNRKIQDALNNSAESGYSDEQQSDDCDTEDDSKHLHKSKEQRIQRIQSLSPDGDTLENIQSFRKCQSEPDLTLLNDLRNDGVENEAGTSSSKVSTESPQKKIKKKKKKEPETAEQMFMRLSSNVEIEDEEEEEEDGEDDLIFEPVHVKQIEKVVEKKQPELTSEEVFNQRRDARLKRMEELNTKIDTYDPKKVSEAEETSCAAQASNCLRTTETDYLKKRAERLERLEKEAKDFCNKLTKTVTRGSQISSHIDDIHNGFVGRQTGSASPTPKASTSRYNNTDNQYLSEQEVTFTTNRAERLDRLETQSQTLLEHMNKTSERASALIQKLDDLHSKFGNDSDVETDTQLQQIENNGNETSRDASTDKDVEIVEEVPRETNDNVIDGFDFGILQIDDSEIENEIASLMDFDLVLDINLEHLDDEDDDGESSS